MNRDGIRPIFFRGELQSLRTEGLAVGVGALNLDGVAQPAHLQAALARDGLYDFLDEAAVHRLPVDFAFPEELRADHDGLVILIVDHDDVARRREIGSEDVAAGEEREILIGP